MGDFIYDELEEDNERQEGRFYLGDGLWSHPETGGDFYHEDERKNN